MRSPPLSKPAKELYRALQQRLDDAANNGLLASSMADIRDVLKPPSRNGADEVIEIGDRRNFHRSPDLPHLTRDDGAWFDFGVTLREGDVIAWSFEIRFNEGDPRWLRFDLNPPGHANDDRARRCHLHPGTDDDGLVVPLGHIAAPTELLDLLLHGLRRVGRVRGEPLG